MTQAKSGGYSEDRCWRDIEYLHAKIKTQTTWMRWSIGGLTSVVLALGMWSLNTQATRFYAADGQALRSEFITEVRTLQSRMKHIEIMVAKFPAEVPPPWFSAIVYQNSSDLKQLAEDVADIKTMVTTHTTKHNGAGRK